MALNPDKSEAILVGTVQRAHSYSTLSSVDVAGHSVPLSEHIKIMGVVLDNGLTMDYHISHVCRTAHYHIRSLRYFRSSLTQDMTCQIACSLVGSRLDYANSLLYGITQKNIRRLQRVQNSLARVVIGPQPNYLAHTSNPCSLFEQLHWLPIEHRIKFKVATISFNTIQFNKPAYLHSLLHPYTPTRSLRSADRNFLSVPFSHTSFGTCGFSVAAPSVWNSLPTNIRSFSTAESFCHHLKAHFFLQAFHHTP